MWGLPVIWSLQTLRFVAALMVVYVHAAQIATDATGEGGLVPQSLQTAGRAGVDIFFVLSGAIITLTARGLTWQHFAWKGFRRIVPVYYLATSIPVIALAGVSNDLTWRDWLATVLLWPATNVMTAPILPVAWTLCFEMLFYVAAAFVIADRRWLIPLGMLYLATLLLRPLGPIFQFLGDPLILEFLAGVAIAFAPKHRFGLPMLIAGFALILLAGPAGLAPTGGTMEILRGDEGFLRLVVYGLPASLIVYGAMQIQARKGMWTELGDASYTIYLTHTIIVTFSLALCRRFPIDPDAIIVLTTAAAVLFAWRLYVRFEIPLLGYLKSRRPVPARR
jgi:exopolysaccharide production protein ExoZ